MAIIYQCSNLPMYWYCRTSVEMTRERRAMDQIQKAVFDWFPNCTCKALTYFPLAIYFISWKAVLELTVRETSSCWHLNLLVGDVAVLGQMSSKYEVCTFWCVLSLYYMYLLFVFCLLKLGFGDCVSKYLQYNVRAGRKQSGQVIQGENIHTQSHFQPICCMCLLLCTIYLQLT